MVSPTLYFVLFLVIVLVGACTAYPNCKAEKAINHMRKIKNVDSYVYNDTHLLNINNKGIKILNKDVFAYYANINRDQVEFIYLMYNNVNEIEAASFEEFVNVRNINFGVNLIETIKKNYFRGARKIDFLNFQSNLIHIVEPGSFDELTQLEYVYLDDNCLTHIPDHLFLHTTRIRNVFLQQNRLLRLPNTFMSLSQRLYGLNVADNRLEDISNLFRFKGLMVLIASNNKLNPINSDGANDNGIDSEMVLLNIDNTTISEINFVTGLKRLRELYAQSNQIKSFDVEKLSGSADLTYISLQSNPLKTVNIVNINEILPKMTVLDISNSPFETSDCRELLELYNLANDKSLNLNINTKILSGCLRI